MSRYTRFLSSFVYEIYRCTTCGAVIEDRETHDEWHESLERVLAKLAGSESED